MSTLSRLSSRPRTLTIDTRHRASELRATLTVLVRMDHSVELCGAIEDEAIAVDILEAGIRKVKAYHAGKQRGLVDQDGQRVATV